MGWVWIDDAMPDHPKVVKAGPLAAWLFICGVAYCNRFNTGGRIPARKVTTLGTGFSNPKREAAKLVKAGLWHEHPDEYEVHDYATYQLSQQQREAKRRAGKAGAAARYGSSNGTKQAKAKA